MNETVLCEACLWWVRDASLSDGEGTYGRCGAPAPDSLVGGKKHPTRQDFGMNCSSGIAKNRTDWQELAKELATAIELACFIWQSPGSPKYCNDCSESDPHLKCAEACEFVPPFLQDAHRLARKAGLLEE